MNLVVANISIAQDGSGRFSLSDLHRAAGGENKHRPSIWADNQQTKELVKELESEAGIPALVSVRGGSGSGTYVCKELVYAYAMWISPKFSLKVIRAYDTMINRPEQSESACHPAVVFKSFMVAGAEYGDALNIARELLGLPALVAPKPESAPAKQEASRPTAPLSGFYTVAYLAEVRGLTVSGMKGLLSRRGYQAYDQQGRYVLTDSGKRFGRMSGNGIVWDVRVLEVV